MNNQTVKTDSKSVSFYQTTTGTVLEFVNNNQNSINRTGYKPVPLRRNIMVYLKSFVNLKHFLQGVSTKTVIQQDNRYGNDLTMII